MKRQAFILAFFLGAFAACLGAIPADIDFSRYSLILERKPFGVPPLPEAAGEGAAVAPDSFATYVRLTALMQEEGGQVRVGFVDKKQKDKSYMLTVGEKADDYEVLEADLAAEIAKLRKGTEEQWLSMKTTGAVTPPNRSPAVKGAGGAPAPVYTAAVSSGANAATNAARRQLRYAAIRRAELEREKLAENARKLNVFREPPDEADEEDEVMVPAAGASQEVDEDEEDDEDEVVIPVIQPEADEEEDEEDDEDEVIREAEIQQHLQSYQKELIKQGLPPLPIPLTAQTDAELVKEGVLPPMAPAKDDAD